MVTTIHSKNNERLLEKEKRHQAIHLLLEKIDLRTHEDIVLELQNQGIKTSQSTVHRDLEHLGIKKNNDGYFKPSHDVQKKFHLDILYDLLVSSDSRTASNVQTYFIKTEKGKAQQIAFHLEQAFSSIVLKTFIDLDSVLVFVDGDEVTDEFLEVFKGEDEVKKHE
jgi:transcriptional regulator of arginine metabolism